MRIIIYALSKMATWRGEEVFLRWSFSSSTTARPPTKWQGEYPRLKLRDFDAAR